MLFIGFLFTSVLLKNNEQNKPKNIENRQNLVLQESLVRWEHRLTLNRREKDCEMFEESL